MNFGIHDCCPGGDGRKPGVSVPLADYIKVRRERNPFHDNELN